MQFLISAFLLITTFALVAPQINKKIGYQYLLIEDQDPIFALSAHKTEKRCKILLPNGIYSLIVHERNMPNSIIALALGWGDLQDESIPGISDLFLSLIKQRIQPDLELDCYAHVHTQKTSNQITLSISIASKNLERLCKTLYRCFWEANFSLEEILQAKNSISTSQENDLLYDVLSLKTESSIGQISPEQMRDWILLNFATRQTRALLISGISLKKCCQLISDVFSLPPPRADIPPSILTKEKISTGKVYVMPMQHHRSQIFMKWNIRQTYPQTLPLLQRSEELLREMFASQEEGSLFHLFFEKCWIYGMQTNFSVKGNIGTLSLHILLTEEGIHHWEEIAGAFRALPQHWISITDLPTYHQQRHELATIHQRFAHPEGWDQKSLLWIEQIRLGDFSLFPYYNCTPCFFDQRQCWNCLLAMCACPPNIYLALPEDKIQTLLPNTAFSATKTSPPQRITAEKEQELFKKLDIETLFAKYTIPKFDLSILPNTDSIKVNTQFHPKKHILYNDKKAPLVFCSFPSNKLMKHNWNIDFSPPLEVRKDVRQRLLWKLLHYTLSLRIEIIQQNASKYYEKLHLISDQLNWTLATQGWTRNHHNLLFEALSTMILPRIESTFFKEAQKLCKKAILTLAKERLELMHALPKEQQHSTSELIEILESISLGEFIGFWRSWSQKLEAMAFYVGPMQTQALNQLWEQWSTVFPIHAPSAEYRKSEKMIDLVETENSYKIILNIGNNKTSDEAYQKLIYKTFVEAIHEMKTSEAEFCHRNLHDKDYSYLELVVINQKNHTAPIRYLVLQALELFLQKLQKLSVPIYFKEIAPTLVTQYTEHSPTLEHYIFSLRQAYRQSISMKKREIQLSNVSRAITPNSLQEHLQKTQILSIVHRIILAFEENEQNAVPDPSEPPS